VIVSVSHGFRACCTAKRLKEENRIGRTVRTSVEKGFNRAFRTISGGRLVSFIAALVLYILTVATCAACLLSSPGPLLMWSRPTSSPGRGDPDGPPAALSGGGVLGVSRGLGAGRWRMSTDLRPRRAWLEPDAELDHDDHVRGNAWAGCTGGRPTTTSSTGALLVRPVEGPSSPSASSPSG